MKKPFFSIVIPTFNRALYLRFALFCILRQTFADYEIVISDNCSTDNTEHIVKAFHSNKIRYIKNTKNIGMIKNQSYSIQRARGKYILFHGDDDFLWSATSLSEIAQLINQQHPGYIRLNYASVSLDSKHVFSYKVNKPFLGDTLLREGASSEQVLSFIIDTDNYFYSGIIIKNIFPKNIRMLDADPSPWISFLFYLTQSYGGAFLFKRHILARWSRRIKKSEDHGFYALVNGRLKAEPYLLAVKKWVSPGVYREFLKRELMTIYVHLFPAIKAAYGTAHLMRVAGRVRMLYPMFGRSAKYWITLIVACIIPQGFLRAMKELYLFAYMRVPVGGENIMKAIDSLDGEYRSC